MSTFKPGVLRPELLAAFIFAAWLGLIGCAHQRFEKELDEKVSATPAMSRLELHEETYRTIETAPNLTPEQRNQLLDLRLKVRGDLNTLSQKSLALRTLLVREVLTQELDRDELYGLRKRMKKIDDQRRDTIFSAVDQANTILGRDLKSSPDLFEDVLGERGRP